MVSSFWLYGHNFTHTGAPLVLAEIARELKSHDLKFQVRLLSWGGLHDRRYSSLQHELAEEGFQVTVLETDQPPPRPARGDRVLLNTLALPVRVIDQVLSWRRAGRISRLDWYAHEGNPSAWLPGDVWPQRLREAFERGELHMRVPSSYTRVVYERWLAWSGSALAAQNPRVCLPVSKSQTLSWDRLRIHLTGMVGCGQKGHLWALRWIERALLLRPQGSPGLRDVELHFVGLESGSYAALARHIEQRASLLLGSSFYKYPHGDREQSLKAMGRANVALSCSLEAAGLETFSLVAAESMALGQVLLRNRTGGWDEQIVDGCTGFDLGSPTLDVLPEHLQLLQRLRDPACFSDQALTAIGAAASQHAQSFATVRYVDWLLAKA